MAASKGTLVSFFLRVANEQPNPKAFLFGIATNNFTSVQNGDGTVTISTSTGGSAASFTLPSGASPLEIVELAELAMQNLDTGVDDPIQWDVNGNPTTVPAINQVPNSQRRVSYAQFGNVQH
jgi:hypothetical protein